MGVMKFRQRRPTETGYYYALEKESKELQIVYVYKGTRYDGSVYYSVNSHYDAGNDCADTEFSDFILWGGPIKLPTSFKMPKRLIYAEKPVIEKLPPSCRRWGHKFEPYTPPEPESAIGRTHRLYRTLLSGEAKYEKCSRCGKVDCQYPELEGLWKDMFSMSYFTDGNMTIKEGREKQFSTYADFGLTVKREDE